MRQAPVRGLMVVVCALTVTFTGTCRLYGGRARLVGGWLGKLLPRLRARSRVLQFDQRRSRVWDQHIGRRSVRLRAKLERSWRLQSSGRCQNTLAMLSKVLASRS